LNGLEEIDRTAIQDLLALYGHAADEATPEAIRRVFTEDAVFDAADMGAGRYEGAAAIAEFFARGKPPHPPSHHTTNVFAWADGDTVRALSKWIVSDGHGDVATGDYRDVLARMDAGWRIAERIAIARRPAGDEVRGGRVPTVVGGIA
jgi:hypothetical protein